MTSCLEKGRDLSKGAEYTILASTGQAPRMQRMLWQPCRNLFFMTVRSILPTCLQRWIADYQGYEELQQKLAEQGPKVGNDDQQVDALMVRLFIMLADACERYGKTTRGGCLRPGSARRCTTSGLHSRKRHARARSRSYG